MKRIIFTLIFTLVAVFGISAKEITEVMGYKFGMTYEDVKKIFLNDVSGIEYPTYKKEHTDYYNFPYYLNYYYHYGYGFGNILYNDRFQNADSNDGWIKNKPFTKKFQGFTVDRLLLIFREKKFIGIIIYLADDTDVNLLKRKMELVREKFFSDNNNQHFSYDVEKLCIEIEDRSQKYFYDILDDSIK